MTTVSGCMGNTLPRTAHRVVPCGRCGHLRQVVLPPAPVVVVDGIDVGNGNYTLINVTAGNVVPLIANQSTCDSPPCTYCW